MRTESPPIVPGFDFEVCIVLDDFGSFRVYREADENDATRETVIRDIIGGQYQNPSHVVAFNTAEGWSRDITEDVAREIVERAERKAEPLSKPAELFVEWATGESLPARTWWTSDKLFLILFGFRLPLSPYCSAHKVPLGNGNGQPCLR